MHAVRSNDFATLPSDFQWCDRAASIASFKITQCYLFHGAFKPPNDICCGHGNCKGHAWLLTAHKAFLVEHGGEPMGFVQFYRKRTQPNDLVSRVLAAQWADAQGM